MDIGEIVLRIVSALVCGMLIGIERKMMHQDAGMRTYGLVSMGCAIFMIISANVYQNMNSAEQMLRVLGQIISGVGFLGAGLIFTRNNNRVGLTSAAGIWVAAAIGSACGLALYDIAIVSLLICLIVLEIFYRLELAIMSKFDEKASK